MTIEKIMVRCKVSAKSLNRTKQECRNAPLSENMTFLEDSAACALSLSGHFLHTLLESHLLVTTHLYSSLKSIILLDA